MKSDPVAEDLVQDVFVKLWINRESVAGKDRPQSWVFTVAANTAYTYLSRLALGRKYQSFVGRSAAVEMEEGTPTGESLYLSKEGGAILHSAIESLSPQRKIIFKMSRIDGLSRKEIAERMNISPETVKNHLSSAMKSVHEYIRKAGILAIFVFLHGPR